MRQSAQPPASEQERVDDPSQVRASVASLPVLPPAARERLDQLRAHMSQVAPSLVGYPCNQRFDYRELFDFLGYTLNNVGDPFADSNFRLNTHDIEREVVASFATLCQAQTDQTWGYVTSGGTEGNMYGLYLARELHPSAIVYFSEDTHYSVAKSLRLLGMRSIMIKSREDGSLDLEDLRETLKIHRDVPAIVFANVGTTMKGAIDDIAGVQQMFDDLRLREHYVHCDAALSGMILPFVEKPPPWNFADGVDSISISGHKMLGSPLPCGVVLARKKYVERIARSVEYVGVLDTTIGGSRNGFTPLVLWYALQLLGEDGMRHVVGQCFDVADYAIERFVQEGVAAWRNPHSITVVFPRPSDEVVRRWQIAPYKRIGHLIAMPHVSRDTVDALLDDYLRSPPANEVRCAVSSAGSRVVASGELP